MLTTVAVNKVLFWSIGWLLCVLIYVCAGSKNLRKCTTELAHSLPSIGSMVADTFVLLHWNPEVYYCKYESLLLDSSCSCYIRHTVGMQVGSTLFKV
jgi:hypothetical protein